jgi:hypothetical protein
MKTDASRRLLSVSFVIAAILLTFLPSTAQSDDTLSAQAPEIVILASNDGPEPSIPAPPPDRRINPNAISTANFTVTYSGTWPITATNAFNYAVGIWSNLLDSPITIDVFAEWKPLGAGVLGSAGSNGLTGNTPGAPAWDTWLSNALADRRACTDQIATQPYEINASFNSTFSSWHLDHTTPPAITEWDFASVVLHELCHGLGYSGSFVTISGGQGYWDNPAYPGIPSIFTRFTEDGGGNPIIGYVSPSVALSTTLEGGAGGIFWNGMHGIVGNGGTMPVMYTPSSWQQGSSFSHFDQATYVGELMRPALPNGTQIHSPSARTLGVLADIGWGDDLVIEAFGYDTGRPEWVQIKNNSSNPINLSDYAIGDEEDIGGGESMYMLPNVNLAAGNLFLMRIRGDDGAWTYTTRPDPTYCWRCGGGGYTDLTGYTPWVAGIGSPNLANGGDEIVLLRTNGGPADPDGAVDDTVIDSICYTSAQDYVDISGTIGVMDGRDRTMFTGGGCLTNLASGSYQRNSTVETCVPTSAHQNNPTAISTGSFDTTMLIPYWPLALGLVLTVGTSSWFVIRRRQQTS